MLCSLMNSTLWLFRSKFLPDIGMMLWKLIDTKSEPFSKIVWDQCTGRTVWLWRPSEQKMQSVRQFIEKCLLCAEESKLRNDSRGHQKQHKQGRRLSLSALMSPHLEWYILLWGPQDKKDRDLLEWVQRTDIKISNG